MSALADRASAQHFAWQAALYADRFNRGWTSAKVVIVLVCKGKLDHVLGAYDYDRLQLRGDADELVAMCELRKQLQPGFRRALVIFMDPRRLEVVDLPVLAGTGDA